MLPGREQGDPRVLDLGRAAQLAPHVHAVGDRCTFEVAARGDVVPGQGGVEQVSESGIGQCDRHLFGGPHVERALLGVVRIGGGQRVGVLGGVATSVGVGEVSQHVLDGLGQDLQEAVLAGDLPGPQVGPTQQGVVVEHLLEVRDQPPLVDRVSREPAADVVVDPARGHRVQGGDDGVERGSGTGAPVVSQQVTEAHRLGELRRGAESAPPRFVCREHRHRGLVEHLGSGQRRAGRSRRVAADVRHQPLRLLHQFVTPVGPRVVDRVEHHGEGGLAAAGVRGEVGAAEERLTVGGHEHRHRPAAVTRHGLGRLHVDGVDVRAFFAVHLDVDEPAVHQRGGRLVLERLVRHDVAPVACRVPHRQQHRAIPLPCQFERLGSPREPVHRVVGMLAQVGAGLGSESVGHVAHCGRSPPRAPISRRCRARRRTPQRSRSPVRRSASGPSTALRPRTGAVGRTRCRAGSPGRPRVRRSLLPA